MAWQARLEFRHLLLQFVDPSAPSGLHDLNLTSATVLAYDRVDTPGEYMISGIRNSVKQSRGTCTAKQRSVLMRDLARRAPDAWPARM